MISHSKKFILISPPKTGSVTLSHFFIKYADYSEIIQQEENNFEYLDIGVRDPDCKYQQSKHNKLSAYQDVVDLNDYYKIGCIRNPYDRMISFWKWSCKVSWKNKIFYSWSFPRWLRILKKCPWAKQTYCDYFFVNNSMKMNDFIRIEHINEDLKRICAKLDIPYKEPTITNNTKRKPGKNYLNKKSIKLINEIFLEDFEQFNYHQISVD